MKLQEATLLGHHFKGFSWRNKVWKNLKWSSACRMLRFEVYLGYLWWPGILKHQPETQSPFSLRFETFQVAMENQPIVFQGSPTDICFGDVIHPDLPNIKHHLNGPNYVENPYWTMVSKVVFNDQNPQKGSKRDISLTSGVGWELPWPRRCWHRPCRPCASAKTPPLRALSTPLVPWVPFFVGGWMLIPQNMVINKRFWMGKWPIPI